MNIFKQEKDKVALRRIEISEVEGISQQEAEALCLPVLGDRDDTTGFTVSYRCIGAVEKDNRQYYVIDVSWLVDNSHWSHIGNLFVSADGKEIYDDTVNQSEYIFEDILWSK